MDTSGRDLRPIVDGIRIPLVVGVFALHSGFDLTKTLEGISLELKSHSAEVMEVIEDHAQLI